MRFRITLPTGLGSAVPWSPARTARRRLTVAGVGGCALVAGPVTVANPAHDGGFLRLVGARTASALARETRLEFADIRGLGSHATLAMIHDAVRRAHQHHPKPMTARERRRRHRQSVRLLQRRLHSRPSGVFSLRTQMAVDRFQRVHGLHADGVAGRRTWRALGVRGHHPVLKLGFGARGEFAAVLAAIAGGNAIATLPYHWGGGHGSFSDSGYDCSGSVSFVLHAAGRLATPLASAALMSYGEPGPGRWITVYANGGHAYMVVNGRRFDTSGQYRTGSRWQPNDRSPAGYVARHPAGL